MKSRKRFICTSPDQKAQSSKYHGDRRTQPLFFFLTASAPSPSGIHPAPPIPANDIPNQSIQHASATLWSMAGEEGPSIAEVNSGTGTRGAVGRDVVEPDCVSSSGQAAPIRSTSLSRLCELSGWVGNTKRVIIIGLASDTRSRCFFIPHPPFWSVVVLCSWVGEGWGN